MINLYNDPKNYDLESGAYNPPGTFLFDLVKQANGLFLELGCGTGRVTIPLAEFGVEMVGLELLPHMLDYAKSKPTQNPIAWVCGDVTDFDLNQKFELIFSHGAVFQHLFTRPEHEAMLAQVRKHLTKNGRFVLDLGWRHPRTMVNGESEEFWFSFTDKQGQEIDVYGIDSFDHVSQIWVQRMFYRPKTTPSTSIAPIDLSLRYFMPQEIESLLHYNGFEIDFRYGDWQGNPFTEKSHTLIYACRSIT